MTHLSNFMMVPTVEEWLDQWLKKYKKDTVQPSTYQNYRAILKPIQAAFARVRLTNWTYEDIQAYVDTLIEMGQYSMARHLLDILTPALNQAVKSAIILQNPVKKVKLPNENAVKIRVLTVEEQQLFLKTLANERLANLFRFQLLTGLRPGEMCALCWDDLDLENGLLTIQKSVRRERVETGSSVLRTSKTKTGRSRVLELTSDMLDLLQQQLDLQELEIAEGKYAETQLIFPNKKGNFLENSSLNRTLERIQLKMKKIKAEELGLAVDAVTISPLSAHTLRHTFATRALEAKVPLKVVSEWLGHSTVRVTGDIYSHVLPELQHVSISQLEQYLNEVLATPSEDKENENF